MNWLEFNMALPYKLFTGWCQSWLLGSLLFLIGQKEAA